MELLETDLSIISFIEYDDWVKKMSISKKILASGWIELSS